MKVIILADGINQNLQPFTEFLPQSLLKINNKPLIEYFLNYLTNKRYIKNIDIITNFMSENFSYLSTKYKKVKILKNKNFKKENYLLIINDNIYLKDNKIYLNNLLLIKNNKTKNIHNSSQEICQLEELINAKIITKYSIIKQLLLVNKNKVKISDGWSNKNFLVNIGNNKKVFRINNSKSLTNRNNEIQVNNIIKNFNITPETHFIGKDFKISNYMDNCRYLNGNNVNEIKQFIKILKKLHKIEFKKVYRIDKILIKDLVLKYEKMPKSIKLEKPYRNFIMKYIKDFDKQKKVLIHGDFTKENILVKDNQIKLIDFEYCRFSNKYWDIASFIDENNVNINLFISIYKNISEIKIKRMIAIINYFWGLWAVNNNLIDYGNNRINKCKNIILKLEENKLFKI